jgi:serine/threonine-protein kinase
MASGTPAKGGKYGRIGKYDLLKHIATGGMGAVYKARDTELGREVALKVLSIDLSKKPILLKRFRREALTGAKLRHENIVTLYECGTDSGVHFLALEFIDGIDLHQYITRKRKLGVKDSLDLIAQATRALDYLHQQGIVHRDIKPSNFLVTDKEGRKVLKLIDLGLARETDDEEFRLTRDNTTLGTVDYMAPEQARDAGSADARSDIYSLGCTWFHMLTGRAPFHQGSLAERLTKHAEAEPPDVRQLNQDIPDWVADILGRMLAKKAADRYQTPAELLKDLENPRRTSKSISIDLLANLAEGEDEPGAAAEDEDEAEAPPSSHEEPALPAARRPVPAAPPRPALRSPSRGGAHARNGRSSADPKDDRSWIIWVIGSLILTVVLTAAVVLLSK